MVVFQLRLCKLSKRPYRSLLSIVFTKVEMNFFYRGLIPCSIKILLSVHPPYLSRVLKIWDSVVVVVVVVVVAVVLVVVVVVEVVVAVVVEVVVVVAMVVVVVVVVAVVVVVVVVVVIVMVKNSFICMTASLYSIAKACI